MRTVKPIHVPLYLIPGLYVLTLYGKKKCLVYYSATCTSICDPF